MTPLPDRSYEEIEPISHERAEAELASGDSARICGALVAMALHDDDWRWAQNACLDRLTDTDTWVRCVSATCLGPLARIHGTLDFDRVEQRLAALEPDEALRDRLVDTRDDFEMFLGSRHLTGRRAAVARWKWRLSRRRRDAR